MGIGIYLSGNKLRIGIIDVFGKKKGIPINGISKDFTHGDMTSAVLTRLTDDLNVAIDKIPVRVRAGSGNMGFDFKSLLKNLKTINNSNEKYDYLNISTSCVIPYEVLGLSANGSELASKEVREKILKKIMSNPPELKLPGQIPHIIEELQRITNEGTEIYLSACNKKNGFNVFSLVDGVHTIGGADAITNLPIQRFSHNPLVESYQPLPVYITKDRSTLSNTPMRHINFRNLVPIESTLSKLSKKELAKKIATAQDYEKLEKYVNELYKSGKFKFDIDFMRFKLVSSVDKQLKNKIFDINKFMKIFEGKFDKEVLEYTFPEGTHCDLMFRQFFDMNSKSKHVISIKKTTKIPNTLSGTSFAAPQGLSEAVRYRLQ